MKNPKHWKTTLSVAAICAVAGLYLLWPRAGFELALRSLNGTATGRPWETSFDTYTNDITSMDVGEFYSRACKRLAALDRDSARKTYTYEDVEGYMGCSTVIQHSGSYEFVYVFGGNDSDIVSVGRASGVFPPPRYLKVTQIPTDQLPPRIIRPWD